MKEKAVVTIHVGCFLNVLTHSNPDARGILCVI